MRPIVDWLEQLSCLNLWAVSIERRCSKGWTSFLSWIQYVSLIHVWLWVCCGAMYLHLWWYFSASAWKDVGLHGLSQLPGAWPPSQHHCLRRPSGHPHPHVLPHPHCHPGWGGRLQRGPLGQRVQRAGLWGQVNNILRGKLMWLWIQGNWTSGWSPASLSWALLPEGGFDGHITMLFMFAGSFRSLWSR